MWRRGIIRVYDNRAAFNQNKGGLIMYMNNAEKEQLPEDFNIWKTAVYIRLSKEDGDKDESDSVASQKEITKEYLKIHPELEFYDFYVDDGCTGTNFDRTEFERLKRDIRDGIINCVLVKDLSRFGRNYADGGYYIDDFFVRHSVRLIAINNSVDTAPGKMNAFTKCVTIGVTNVINESVSAATSVNVRGTLNLRRKKGEFIGSFAAYGYLKNPEDRHKLIVDEEAAEVVRMIFDKFVSGMAILEITTELNKLKIPNPSAYKKKKGFKYRHPAGKTNNTIWPESSVRRILKNEMYIGNMVQGKNVKLSYKIKQCVAVPEKDWYVVKDTHEPIIDKETFRKAQALFEKNTRVSPQEKKVGLFAGLVKCADCHRGMSKKSNKQNGKEYHYYRCSTAKVTKGEACPPRSIRIDKLEETVLVFLRKMVEVATEYDEMIKAINSNSKRKNNSNLIIKALEKNEKEAEFTNEMIRDLYPDWKRGDITREEYMRLKSDFQKKIEKLDEESKVLKERLEEQENCMENNSFIHEFKKLGNIEKLTRPLLLELIDEILIHEGNRITICLKCKDAFEQAVEYIEINKDIAKPA